MRLYTRAERIESLKSGFRDFKLSLITGDLDINVDMSRIPTDILEFISKTFPNEIITGSLALMSYGLLKRKFGDIDIFINDKKRYPIYIKGRYGDEDMNMSKNRLGYVEIPYKRGFFYRRKVYKVDFFENDESIKYQEIEYSGKKFKIQDMSEILNNKMMIATGGSYKHIEDLENIFTGRVYDEFHRTYR